jgi:lactate dehydrogenase-like 2-hydroxyacid dehydrogenase
MRDADLLQVRVPQWVFPDLLEPLGRRYRLLDAPLGNSSLAQEDAGAARCVDALLVDPSVRVDAAALARHPGLRLVSTISVGFNHIDVDACSRAGIPVANTPGVLTEATADHAWALMLATARRTSESEHWLRAGHWTGFSLGSFLGADVHGATLGILGMGRIGSAIARRAQGFSMPVIFHNRTRPGGDPVPGAPVWVPSEELFARSDYLVIVLPYGPQTHHRVGEAELRCMKPGAVLVNIARGGVVDDAALARVLGSGHLAGAGLDVFEGEPAVHPALLAQDRVVLTPHIGSATASSRRGMVRMAIRNLDAGLSGERPESLADAAAWPGRCAL